MMSADRSVEPVEFDVLDGYPGVCSVTRVTPEDGFYVHTYYDVCPFSPSGRYLLCSRLPYQDRPPVHGDTADTALRQKTTIIRPNFQPVLLRIRGFGRPIFRPEMPNCCSVWRMLQPQFPNPARGRMAPFISGIPSLIFSHHGSWWSCAVFFPMVPVVAT